jgi:uncharacterized protein YjiS (DUF1127 family)
MQQHLKPTDFPQQDARFDLSKIDPRSLSPEQWNDLKTQIYRRARSDRDRAISLAIGGALGWAWKGFRHLLLWGALRAAWISLVRKQREQVAAAQLRGIDDQGLADMGLTRGDIESRVGSRMRRIAR